MSRESQTPEDWARTVDQLPRPVRWGQVEDEVLDRQPAFDQSTADKVMRVLGFTILGILAIPTFGSSVVGLVLYLLGVSPIMLRVLFVLAIGVSVLMLIFWREDRERSPVKVLLAGGSGAVSLVTYFLMRSGPEEQADAWAALLMLIAAVVGLGAAVVMVVAAKPDPKRPRRRRMSLSPGKDIAYVRARKQALHILVERGLAQVDTDRQKQMAEMPLGTWYTLDE